MVSSRLFLRMPVSPAGDSPPLTPRHERLRHNIKVVPDGSVSCSHPCGAQARATQNFCSIFCTLHTNLKHILAWFAVCKVGSAHRLSIGGCTCLFLSGTNCPGVVDLPIPRRLRSVSVFDQTANPPTLANTRIIKYPTLEGEPATMLRPLVHSVAEQQQRQSTKTTHCGEARTTTTDDDELRTTTTKSERRRPTTTDDEQRRATTTNNDQRR